MRKLFVSQVIILSVLMVMVVAVNVQGSTLTVEHLSGYYAANAGEFTVFPSADWSGVVNLYAPVSKNQAGGAPNFQSFCLEANEKLPDGTYNTFFNNKAINGGVGPAGDPLSKGSAWLFLQFAQGILPGYNYTPGPGRAASALALQEAIWYLEDETVAPSNPIFLNLAITQFVSLANAKADNNGQYPVAVLNDYFPNGALAQDLMTVVPEPATMLLLGSGLLGLAGFARRRFRKN